MSPDVQKALIAGGITAFGCEHFPMKRGHQDFSIVPCPDMFELDMNTKCWVQVRPTNLFFFISCQHFLGYDAGSTECGMR